MGRDDNNGHASKAREAAALFNAGGASYGPCMTLLQQLHAQKEADPKVGFGV